MQTLSTALAADASSVVFRTNCATQVWLDLHSDTADQPAELEYSYDNATFKILKTDGTEQSLTTNELKMFSLPGGLYFRVTIGSGATDTVDVRVDSNAITLSP